MRTVSIDVRGNGVLPKKHGHVLVYDKAKDEYYAVTYEDLFAAQNEAIERLESQYRAELKAVKGEFDSFKKDMTSRFNDLLESYRQVSSNLINMVEQEEE